jgi:hypothetical protein
VEGDDLAESIATPPTATTTAFAHPRRTAEALPARRPRRSPVRLDAVEHVEGETGRSEEGTTRPATPIDDPPHR